MKPTNPKQRIENTLQAVKTGLRGLDSAIPGLKLVAKIIDEREGDIVITGIGKTGFIGQKFAATLTSLGQRAFYIHPTEALHGDLGALSEGDVLISLSFSGESKEVVGITKYAKKNFNVPVISLSKNSNTSLAKISNYNIDIPVTEEGSPNGIAPMASTTITLVLCDMIAAAVTHNKFTDNNFATFHPGGALGLKLKKIKDHMSTGSKIPKVKESSTLLMAVKEINIKKLGICAVVGKSGQVIGAVSDGDIRRFVLKSKDKIHTAMVKDTMTPSPKCVDENSSLQEAFLLMENHKITSIFVVNKKGKLTGIIHVHDVIEQTL